MDVRAIISCVHEVEIKAFFNKWIDKFFQINHFAILIILPDNDIVHLSSNKLFVEKYHDARYGLFDEALRPVLYENWQFYPWNNKVLNNKITNKIHAFREDKFNLNGGTNFVRKIETQEGKFHIIYAVASYKSDPLMSCYFANNINNILEIGDFSYNELHHIFQEHVKDFTLPKINKFKPYDSGIKDSYKASFLDATNKNFDTYKDVSDFITDEINIKSSKSLPSKEKPYLKLVQNNKNG